MLKVLQFLMATCLVLSLSVAQAADLKELSRDISDSVITAKITAKYAKNKNLNPLKISVSTEEGVVKLNGFVKNKQAFVEALRLAKDTKGVKLVLTDDLEIKSVNTKFTDAYITTKVEAAVLKAKVLDDESIPLVGINATTTNGIVTLSGRLKNDQAINAILKRVAAVKGVVKIISKLEAGKGSHENINPP